MIWIFYNLLFAVVFVLLTPHFLWRMRRRGGYRTDFLQRFGCYSDTFRSRIGKPGRTWLHAVSVGEVLVALEFIREAKRQYSDSRFVLSVTTSTGHKIARERLDESDLLMYFPIDAPWIMRRVLRILQPVRIVLVECEIWPNLIRLATQQDIPVSLINGRMSDSSFRGYGKLGIFTRRILPLVNPILMQGEQDRDRILALGANPETTEALGSAKFDAAPSGTVDDAVAREVLKAAGMEGCILLVGGSTWPGEEEVLVDLYRELKSEIHNLALILVPRHFERASDILEMLVAKGQPVMQRSKLEAIDKDAVLLVDSTGELMAFYQVADVVFVGKSICEHGGQNPLEPLGLGKATVVGPNMENFPSVMELLLKDEALMQVQNSEALKQTLKTLLIDEQARRGLGERGAACVASHRGVMRKTVEKVFARG